MSSSDFAAVVLSEPSGSAHWRLAVGSLAKLALSPDPTVAAEATRTIFAKIVEPWSDRFEPADCDRYLGFMAECLLAGGSPVADKLRRLGFESPEKLAARGRGLRQARPLQFPSSQVRKVMVLSRVTLGADIAVTSVVIEAAKRAFSQASVEFVGGAKGAAFFAGSSRVRHLPISYSRGASFADRLQVWLEMYRVIEESISGLQADEYVILDPDSRLTQLGILPAGGSEANYRFFESRSFGGTASESIGRITARWCGDVLPGTDPDDLNPRVELSREDIERGSKLRQVLTKPIAAVSLGVGGRDSKRLSSAFEDELLETLRRAGYAIVLDYGAGDAEKLQVDERVERFKGTAADISGAPAQLVTWQGSLASFGGLIAACDCYVGYDSASSHLAAALGIPVVEVFAGAASERMRQRWTPTGSADVRMIAVESETSEAEVLTAVAKAIAR